MSIAQRREPLRLPTTLEAQLHAFRRRVWTIKMAEAAAAAVFAVMTAFLCVFALDRLWDTPRWLRLGVWAGAVCGCAIVPLYLLSLDLATAPLGATRPTAHREAPPSRRPVAGDHRIGSQRGRAGAIAHPLRSGRSLRCPATLRNAISTTRRRIRGIACGAGSPRPVWRHQSASARHFPPRPPMPGSDFSRRGPGRLDTRSLPSNPCPRRSSFPTESRSRLPCVWQRTRSGIHGKARSNSTRSSRSCRRFRTAATNSNCRRRLPRAGCGCASAMPGRSCGSGPCFVPSSTSIVAEVTLPAYLGQPNPLTKDVRGGAVALVKGSRARFAATASRKLSAASVDGRPQTPAAAVVESPLVDVDGPRKIRFEWQDEFGLAGKEPFTLTVTASDDEAPSLACEDLPRSKVVLDSEQLNFRVKAEDDFGVKQIGIDWQGADDATATTPAKGERIVAAGGFEKRTLEAAGTFSAQSLGIEPQPIHLRVFAEDYFPGRERVYSPNCVLYVLNAEQHAIWITEQLNKWHRQALEVRDRELQLHETNKQLRDLSPEELDRPDTRRRIENQSAAERANGRRLTGLAATGEDLLRQAARNPQFDVGYLDRWAEMLQILKDIAAKRMPSVADVLEQASKSRTAAAHKLDATGPMAGQVRAAGSGKSSSDSPGKEAKTPPVPQVADVESSLQPPGKSAAPHASRKKPSAPSLRLPMTTLIGQAAENPQSPQSPAGEKMQGAVRQQQDLLAEFEKIVNELNNILANLEGSTLVKRLKAASREQYRVAGRVGDLLEGSFGLGERPIRASQKTVFSELSGVETKSSQNVSMIMDDLQAYFERRKFVKFQDGLGRDEVARRHWRPEASRRRAAERTRLIDRSMRILVGHHGPLGGGSGRSGLQRNLPVFRIAG